LTYDTTRQRGRHRAIVGAIVLAILAATLVPSRSGILRPFSPCLTCDFRWLADGVLNVALFVPLGLAAGWRATSFWRVAVAGALLSTAIEVLQMMVPGRDPSLRDIVANTTGAALGAALIYRPRVWMLPTARQATWLMGAAALAILAAIVCTGVLLGPAEPRDPIHVSRAGDDAVVRYQSRADVIGLDQPAYYLDGMFRGVERFPPVTGQVSHRWSGWCLRIATANRCRIGPTPGRGWAVFIYPAAAAHRWADGLIDIAWVAMLFLPLGFWTTRRTLGVSAGTAITLLAVVPPLSGLVPATLGEWIGGFAGLAAGYAAHELLRRRFAIAGVQPSRRSRL